MMAGAASTPSSTPRLPEEIRALLHVANAQVEYSYFSRAWMVKLTFPKGGHSVELVDDTTITTLEEWVDVLIHMKERMETELG